MHTMRLTAAVFALIGGIFTAQVQAERARIIVRTEDVVNRVNPLVFGQNVEAADPKFIFSDRSGPVKGRTGDGVWDCDQQRPVPEVVELARRAGVKALRYPGGCLVHNFDWKKAVGPVESRPDFAFGVAEFIELCREIDAEPIMNVSAYVGGPREAADLVEYLNAPADRDHPWARKRAGWGHPEPFGVVYFEMGNESDHGNHDVKPFRRHTATSYAAWFGECARRMKDVDPGVRVGALMGSGTGPTDAWNRTVLNSQGDQIDFVVVHTYAVGLFGEPTADATTDRLMRACMASTEQIEHMLGQYRHLIQECTGRDIPLAITEYNAAFVQNEPLPYRFTFGAALHCADYIRAMLQPESNVLMANYWHFINGYWGMVRGPRLPSEQPREWKLMPAFHLFALWNRHVGDRLVAVDVHGPRLEFEGLLRVQRASATKPVAAGRNLMKDVGLLSGEQEHVIWTASPDDSVRLEVAGLRGDAYPWLAQVPVPEPGTYELSYEGRRLSLGGSCRIGLGLMDSRGWNETHSANAVEGVENAGEWTTFSGRMTTLPDCESLVLLWRILPGEGEVNAIAEVRNIRLTPVEPAPPYAAITATASLSADGRTLYLVVFNKNHGSAIDAEVVLEGFAVDGGQISTVTAPVLEARRVSRQSGPLPPHSTGGFSYRFPARSMNGLQLHRRLEVEPSPSSPPSQ